MASNIQRGTRGLSAGDWTRIKKLRGARNYESDKTNDLVNPGPIATCGVGSNRHVYCSSGTSKIRRTVSSWIDYRAALTGDYVLESRDENTNSTTLTNNRLCTSDGTTCQQATNPLKHNPFCITNTYDRIVKRS